MVMPMTFRFLDARPDRARIIGLYSKGRAKKDMTSGFVQITQIGQVAPLAMAATGATI